MSLARLVLPLVCVAALSACNPAAQNGATTQAANDTSATTAVSCDSPAQPLAIGASAHGEIPAAQSYPDNARYFCINVGDGVQNLTLELTGMSADLDLYVGHGAISSVQGVDLQNGGTYEWKSNDFGNGPERVVIDHPAAAIYYAEIVSYSGQASGFDFAVH